VTTPKALLRKGRANDPMTLRTPIDLERPCSVLTEHPLDNPLPKSTSSVRQSLADIIVCLCLPPGLKPLRDT
jgi:hypothetical protein